MVKPKLIAFLLSLLLLSCVSPSEIRKMDSFEKTAEAYENAIRWSDFESASLYLKPDENANIPALVDKLKQFKVTSYTVKDFFPSKDKSQVLLIAVIEYFKANQLVLKRISQRQLWEYDMDLERWHLTSGLPEFQ